MKDFGKKALEEGRPDIDALDGINFCLDKLYKDKTKNVSNEIVHGLSFEELIGVLLIARDKLQENNND